MRIDWSEHIHRIDGLLALAGVAGLCVFFLGLPALVPDGAGRFTQPREALIDAATQYLIDQGYETDGLVWQVYPRRDPAVLDTLQQELGRRAALRLIREHQPIPAYHWFVRAEFPAPPAAGEDSNIRLGESRADEWFELRLDDEARVWWFRSAIQQRVFQPVHRAILLQVLPDSGRTASLVDALSRMPDSTLLGALLFGLRDSTDQQGPPPDFRRGGGPPQAGAGPGGIVRLPPLDNAEAIRIARRHLDTLLPDTYGFQADTLYTRDAGADALPLPAHITRSRGIQIVYQPDRASAVVVFRGAEPTTSLPMEARIGITAGGLLLDAEVAYSPLRNTSEENESVFSRPSELFKMILLVLVGIIVIVSFFRRLSARLIDVRSALQDALIGGLFLALIVATTMGEEMTSGGDDFWLGLLIAFIATLVAGSVGGFITFVASSATDATARMTWPDKVQTLTYTRNFNYYNIATGLSVLRGLALAGVILGVLVGLLALLGDVPIHLERDNTEFLGEVGFSATALFVGIRGWGTQMLLLTVILGIGAEFSRRFPSRRAYFLAMPALLTGIHLSPYALLPDAWTWLISVALAFLVAAAFWRYDAITCFIALMTAGLLWDVAPGWLPEGAPDRLEAYLSWVFAGGVGLLGLVGLASRRLAPPDMLYRPAYIVELAQQERLRGELETAHRVQASFLPTEMPRLPGADIAALCLPAQEVGGDYYDFIRIDTHRLALVVGDVSGKGIQAAFYMTLTKGFLRALCREVPSPAEVLSKVNTLFCENAPRGMFISMIFGILDTREGTFTFVRAGHDPIIARRMDHSQAEFIRPGGMAIGLAPGAPFDRAIHETTLHLKPGDMLAFYTDGCTDAVNADNEQFGTERLLNTVATTPDGTAAEILHHIVEDIDGFTRGISRPDDLTVLVIRMDGVALGPGKEPGSHHHNLLSTHAG